MMSYAVTVRKKNSNMAIPTLNDYIKVVATNKISPILRIKWMHAPNNIIFAFLKGKNPLKYCMATRHDDNGSEAAMNGAACDNMLNKNSVCQATLWLGKAIKGSVLSSSAACVRHREAEEENFEIKIWNAKAKVVPMKPHQHRREERHQK